MNMDSLREKLSPFDADESLWLGERWNKVRSIYSAPSFEVGGAGYVFSWKAVDVLIERLDGNHTDARKGCDVNKYTPEEELMLSEDGMKITMEIKIIKSFNLKFNCC